MAKAGFVYTPAEVGDDEVTCLFCAVSLSGWQDGDDAWYATFRMSYATISQ